MVESIKELRSICGSKKKQPLYMELVSMKISIYFTKLLLYTRMSADYVTISMIIFLIVGSILMALGNLWHILIGISIIHFTIILDNVNGEVARYWKEDGLIGTFLEQVFHNLLVPLVFFALAYGIFAKTGFTLILIFGFLSSIFGMPIVLNSIKDAVVAERLNEIKSNKKTQRISVQGKANIKGGDTQVGKNLYGTYGLIREFWAYPANIVYISILAVIEVINLYYGFVQQYYLLSLFVILHGSVSTFVQFMAFLVNYKGKTVNHYYKTLFEGKK